MKIYEFITKRMIICADNLGMLKFFFFFSVKSSTALAHYLISDSNSLFLYGADSL